jgi:hypothetical protein
MEPKGQTGLLQQQLWHAPSAAMLAGALHPSNSAIDHNLDQEKHSGYNWPMFVETEDAPDGVPISLEPGDIIIYRGCDVEHWREKFLGLNHAQLFLHYNDPTGPFGIRLDGRPILGVPKQFQK